MCPKLVNFSAWQGITSTISRTMQGWHTTWLHWPRGMPSSHGELGKRPPGRPWSVNWCLSRSWHIHKRISHISSTLMLRHMLWELSLFRMTRMEWRDQSPISPDNSLLGRGNIPPWAGSICRDLCPSEIATLPPWIWICDLHWPQAPQVPISLGTKEY